MIAYCGCTVAGTIQVHSGSSSASQATNPKPTMSISFPANGFAVEYQNKRYGEGMGVHNLLHRKPQEPLQGRCTVCRTKRSL